MTLAKANVNIDITIINAKKVFLLRHTRRQVSLVSDQYPGILRSRW
jgi:hypothetical protein